MPAELDDYLCEIQCEEFYGEDPETEEEEEWPDRDTPSPIVMRTVFSSMKMVD